MFGGGLVEVWGVSMDPIWDSNLQLGLLDSCFQNPSESCVHSVSVLVYTERR